MLLSATSLMLGTLVYSLLRMLAQSLVRSFVRSTRCFSSVCEYGFSRKTNQKRTYETKRMEKCSSVIALQKPTLFALFEIGASNNSFLLLLLFVLFLFLFMLWSSPWHFLHLFLVCFSPLRQFSGFHSCAASQQPNSNIVLFSSRKFLFKNVTFTHFLFSSILRSFLWFAICMDFVMFQPPIRIECMYLPHGADSLLIRSRRLRHTLSRSRLNGRRGALVTDHCFGV